MIRFLSALSLIAAMTSASGCCHHLGGGNPCNPCGPYGSNYGGYPAYSYVAPSYATTAAVPATGFVTASAPAACDCNTGAPLVTPY